MISLLSDYLKDYSSMDFSNILSIRKRFLKKMEFMNWFAGANWDNEVTGKYRVYSFDLNQSND